MKKAKTGKAGEGPKLRITLVRSASGCPRTQRETVKGLGLRKINSAVIRPDRPEIRGMVKRISHLLKVEVAEK
ncbi:MAG: 50S ribosomal protein L30 [Acidobacteriota bacterium]